MLPEISKRTQEVKYVSQDSEPYAPFIGENVVVSLQGGMRYGTYLGTSQHGDVVLMPHVSLGVVDGSAGAFWNESKPMFVNSHVVQSVNPTTREYINLAIKDITKSGRKSTKVRSKK